MDNYWSKPVGYTNASSDVFNFSWSIDTFYKTTAKGSIPLKSPFFYDAYNNNNWYLQVSSIEKYEFSRYKKYIKFTLINKNIKISNYIWKLSITVNKRLLDISNNSENDSYTIKESRLFNNDTFIQNINLLIKCKVTTKRQKDYIADNLYTIKRHSIEVYNKLEQLLKDKILTNVTFKISEENFEAHKIVLVSKSPVFMTMFDNDKKEQNQSVVEIADLSANVIKEMVYFMYTGNIADIEKVVYDLLSCADKYSIMDLKEKCSQYLSSILSTDNVLHILTLAEQYQCRSLKESVHHFIGTQIPNCSEFIKSVPFVNSEMLKFIILSKKCNYDKESSHSTNLFRNCHSFIWKVDHLEQGMFWVVESPIFEDSRHKTNWSLKLSLDSVTLSLVLENNHDGKLISSLFDFEFIIFDDKSKVFYKNGSSCDFNIGTESKVNFVIESKLFDFLNYCTSNKTLTVHCNVLKRQHLENISHNNINFIEKYDFFSNLKKSSILTDVKLVLNDESILDVHKIILAVNSPVFLAMFESDMKEKRENIVKITDFSPDIIKEMILFIYTGRVNIIDESVYDLLNCADKYCILGLKEVCQQYLGSKLSVDNVLDILLLPVLQENDQLVSKVCQFISTHPEVTQSSNFHDLSKLQSVLSEDALKKILCRY